MAQTHSSSVEIDRLSRWTPFLGAPIVYLVEQKIDREVKEDEFAELLAFIRMVTRKHGKVKQNVGALKWENKTDVESMRISLTPVRGETKITVGSQYGGLAFFAFFSAAFTGFALSATLAGFLIAPQTVLGAAIIVVAGVAGAHWVARLLWRRTAPKREFGLRILLERLADRTGEISDSDKEKGHDK